MPAGPPRRRLNQHDLRTPPASRPTRRSRPRTNSGGPMTLGRAGAPGAGPGGVAEGNSECRPLMTCDGFFGAPRGGRGRCCGAFWGGSGRLGGK